MSTKEDKKIQKLEAKLASMRAARRRTTPARTRVQARGNPNARANRRRRQRRNRAMMRAAGGVVTGRGAYFGDIGAKMGSDAGNYLGRNAGALLDSVFGFGEYAVPRRNTLVSGGSVQFSPGGPPRVINTKKGEATVVAHREYIGDVTSGSFVPATTSTDFKLESYALNPGNPLFFPWLASMAINFQEWEMQGALVELITEAADFSTQFSIGNVMMATDYNPISPDPVSKSQLLQLEYSSSTKASNSLLMPIECARTNNSLTHLFVANNSDYEGTDARSFDLGTVHVGSQGIPVEDAKLAELWVTYEVALYKPRLSPEPLDGDGCHIHFHQCTTAKPYGTADDGVILAGSDSGFVLSGDVITFPTTNANWMLTFYWAALGMGTATGYSWGLHGLTLGPDQWSDGTGNEMVDGVLVGNGTSNKLIQSFAVYAIRDHVGPRTITINAGGALPITTVFADFWALRMPLDLIQ